MALIHEKIVAQLEQRKLKKRDLARALGVSPQTATDICKGRSAITLPHLRNLVSYFGLRADYWIDDRKLLPEPSDAVPGETMHHDTSARPDRPRPVDLDRLLQRVRPLVAQHRQAFLHDNPDLTADERSALGLAEGAAQARTATPATGPLAGPGIPHRGDALPPRTDGAPHRSDGAPAQA